MNDIIQFPRSPVIPEDLPEQTMARQLSDYASEMVGVIHQLPQRAADMVLVDMCMMAEGIYDAVAARGR